MMHLEILAQVEPTLPVFDGMYFLGLLSRLAHIFSAIMIVGGTIYLRCVLAKGNSAGSESETDEARQQRLFAGNRGQWGMLVGVATLFLIASGLYNYIVKVRAWDMPSAYHMIFGIKFLLAFVVFFAAAIVGGKTSAAERARAGIKKWLNLALVAAFLVVAMGSVLRTFEGVPKTDAEPAQQQTSAD